MPEAICCCLQICTVVMLVFEYSMYTKFHSHTSYHLQVTLTHLIVLPGLFVVNPRRACAVRVTVLGLCVCYHVFATTHNKPAKKRHQSVQNGSSHKKYCVLKLWCDPKTKSTSSVYLQGTINHNEGRVSTPACYLLL